MRGSNGGALPNTPEAASSFALNDIGLCPMRTVLFVPKQPNGKYNTAFGRIVEELNTAIESAEPDRTKRIGTAPRWYAGISKLFLRTPRRDGRAYVVNIFKLRLDLLRR